MPYSFWAWAQGTVDLDEEEKEQSLIEAESHTKSPTAASMGDATTEEQANSVTAAQTTNRVSANTVDYDEEEKEQAMSGAKKVASAHTEDATSKSSVGKDQDDDEAGHGSRQGNGIYEFRSRLLPASTSTTTVSITIYETLTAPTTIFVKPTTMPMTNTVATTTVTAAASPALETIPPGLLQTVTTVPTIPMSPLDPDLGPGMHEHVATLAFPVTATNGTMTKGPTTSALAADDAVGIHIPRGAVAATLFLLCAWVVVSGGIWIRGTHFHRAMLLVVWYHESVELRGEGIPPV